MFFQRPTVQGLSELSARHVPNELELELLYLHMQYNLISHRSQCCGVKWTRVRCALYQI